MDKPLVRIERWSVVSFPDPYKAPEQLSVCLAGQVYGHPRTEEIKEGEYITTSKIVGSSGRIVETLNTKYLLGKPSEDYLDYLKGVGHVLDETQPIKL